MAKKMKCGHCKGRHDTVAEVRECSEQGTTQVRRDGGAPSLTTSYNRETARRASIAALRPRSGGNGMVKTSPNGILQQLGRMSSREADLAMAEAEQERERAEDQRGAAYKAARDEKALAGYRPRNLDEQRTLQQYTGGNKQSPVTRTTTGFPDVPEGHYALEIDGAVKFYKVDKPTEARWAGWVFLSAQASDDLHPIKNREHKERILRAIAEDVEGAMTRYGQEIGRCGKCHRTLTDETSRAYGIGPDCRGKLGF